jgi:hypothetical protein
MTENTRNEHAGQLFDFLVDHPEGVTWEDAAAAFPWARHRSSFGVVVRRLRRTLGNDDEMTVVCDPRRHRQSWLYRLVGDPSEADGWQANRIGDAEARLLTILDVSRSVARRSDGRTLVGKKARKIESTIGYLVGELADLESATR